MSKLRTASPKIQGRFLRRRLLVLLLAAGVLAFGLARWWPQEKHPKFRSLAQIVAAEQGFEVAEEPSLPGPYQELGSWNARLGEEAIGSFWANGKKCRFHVPAVAGEEVRVIGLLSQAGGGPTYVVLKRHVATGAPEPKR